MDEILLHENPFGDGEDEKFEELIERLLERGPVALTCKCFPSFREDKISYYIIYFSDFLILLFPVSFF